MTLSKLLLSITLLFIFSLKTVGQLIECQTKDPNNKYFLIAQKGFKELKNRKSYTKYPINVALRINIIRKSDGSGGLDESVINRAIDILNEDYKPALISFFKLDNSINYINNNDYYSFSENQEDEITKIYDVDNAINIYLVNSFTSSIGGYSYFPDVDKETNRVFAYYNDNNDLVNKVLPHELGHYFGLFHTFEGNHSSNEEYVTRGPMANCDIAGDLLCDTPADPYGKLIVIGGPDCAFSFDFKDQLGEIYKPQTGNLMSYYRNCGNYFTEGQINLLSFGISRRLAPNPNGQKRYSILGKKTEQNIGIITGNLINSNNQKVDYNICRRDNISVEYSNSTNAKEVEAWLLTENNKNRYLIGSGTSSPLKLNFEKLPNIPFPFNVQIVAKDESSFGTVSDKMYNLLEIPKIELSGNSEVFLGEKASFYIKSNTNSAQITIVDNDNKESKYDFSGIPGMIKYEIVALKPINLTIKTVLNSCGTGIGNGNAKINIAELPVANSIFVSTENNYWCKNTQKVFNIIANGTIPNIKSFKILNQSSGQKSEINDFIFEKKTIKLPEKYFNFIESEAFNIEIIFENYDVIVSSNTINKAKDIDINLSKTYLLDRTRLIKIPIPSSYFVENTKIIFSNNLELNLAGLQQNLNLNIWENSNFAVSQVFSNSCQNINIRGDLDIKFKEPIELDLFRNPFTCSSQKIKTKILKQQGFLSQFPQIIFYDELNREQAKIEGEIDNENYLNLKIPSSLKNDGLYYIRVITLDSSYSKPSNKFYIGTSPSVEISGIYGSQYNSRNIIKNISGTLPIELNFLNGSIFKINKYDDILNIANFEDGTQTITSIKNQCGTSNINQKFKIDKNAKIPNCIPQAGENSNIINISSFFISEFSNNKTIYNRENWNLGRNGYQSYLNNLIYLKKGISYTANIENWSSISADGSGGANSPISKLWIDFNDNGDFDTNEEIKLTYKSITYSGVFVIPNWVTPGPKLLRIKTKTNDGSDSNWNACSNLKSSKTEDYYIEIGDNNQPTIEVVASKNQYCKNETITFNIYGQGYHPNNSLRVFLQDKWGNELEDFGVLGLGYFEKKVKFPFVNNEEIITIGVEDLENQIKASSKRIFLFLPPKITLMGVSNTSSGSKTNVYYKLENGFRPILNYSYNGVLGNTSVYRASVDKTIYSFQINAQNSGDVIPVGINDNACGSGSKSGKTTINVIGNNEKSLEIKYSGGGGYSSCEQLFNYTYNISNAGSFPNDNYFNLQMIDYQGNTIKDLGNFKNPSLPVEYNGILPSANYLIKVVSRNPLIEYILTSIDTYYRREIDIIGNNAYFEGEKALFEVKNNINYFTFTTNIEPARISTNNFFYRFGGSVENFGSSFAVIPAQGAYCSESKYNKSVPISIIKKIKPEILIQKSNQFCVNGPIEIPYFSNNKFEKDNYFQIQIIDSKGQIIEQTKGVETNKYLTFKNIKTTNQENKYRIKINSTNPYIESNFTDEFIFGPKVTAVLSTDSEQKKMYEGSTIEIKVKLKGIGPWALEFNDGKNFSDISDSIFTYKPTVTLGQTSLKINSVTTGCGYGISSGEIKLDVIQIPQIQIAPFAKNNFCIAENIDLEYATIKGEFIDEPKLILELFEPTLGETIFLKNLPKTSDKINFQLPKELNLGKKYLFRIRNTSPAFYSNYSKLISLSDIPSAKIENDIVGIEGFEYRLIILITSNSPVNYTLNNGEGRESVSNFYEEIFVKIKSGENFELTKVENACGVGKIIKNGGNVKIIDPSNIENPITIYSNPLFAKENYLNIRMVDIIHGNDFQVDIFDFSGKLVYSELMKINKTYSNYQLNLSTISKGLYVIRFSKEKFKTSLKLVVN